VNHRDDPEYIVRLLGQVTTVSLETGKPVTTGCRFMRFRWRDGTTSSSAKSKLYEEALTCYCLGEKHAK
jgi:hypothetical protein